MLALGLHTSSTEAEVKNALGRAARLLAKYNINEAQLLLAEEAAPDSLAGGMAAVRIEDRATRAPVRSMEYFWSVASAAAENFDASYFQDCYYSTSCKECKVTFYGIRTNAQMAAFAFAGAFNRVAEMTAAYKVAAAEWQQSGGFSATGHGSAAAYTQAKRRSYRTGLASGLRDAVHQEAKARKAGERQRLAGARAAAEQEAAALSAGERGCLLLCAAPAAEGATPAAAPLGAPAAARKLEPPEPAHAFRLGEADEDSDADDAERTRVRADTLAWPRGGEDTLGGPVAAPAAAPAPNEAAAPASAAGAQSASAAAKLAELEKEAAASHALVVHSKNVGEDLLKAKGIKLTQGRGYRQSRLLSAAYADGVRDSKQINLNQRTLATTAATGPATAGSP